MFLLDFYVFFIYDAFGRETDSKDLIRKERSDSGCGNDIDGQCDMTEKNIKT